MPKETVAVSSPAAVSSTDQINHLTGCLGYLEHITVKTLILKKEVF